MEATGDKCHFVYAAGKNYFSYGSAELVQEAGFVQSIGVAMEIN